jgi:hypothetical protein
MKVFSRVAGTAVRTASNFTLERTAGSRALAAAAHRGRSAQKEGGKRDG